MKTPRYRMYNKETLHQKRLGKHTMTKIIIKGRHSTSSEAGIFYHYTSPEGLKGILKNRVLYFTDCRFLNDHNERLQINDELDLFWHNNKKNYDANFVKLLKNIKASNYEDSAYSYMESDRSSEKEAVLARYFIFSTSVNNDSLNLWKYYAKNNNYDGYCIGLFTIALTDEWIDRNTGVAIESGLVVYSSEKKQTIIYNAVEKLYDAWCKYKVSDDFNQKIIRDFESWVSITSLFFKNKCFEGEEEYRFIAIVPSAKLKSLTFDYSGFTEKMYDFRIVDGVLVPYIKMPFDFWNFEECWPIASIGIGPSMNYEQKKLGLEHFVTSFDYSFPNLNINHSKISLRY